MVNQVVTSDGEEHAPPQSENNRKRKKLLLTDEEEEEREKMTAHKNAKGEEEEAKKVQKNANEEEEEEEFQAQPLGEVIKVSGKGTGRMKHFNSFEYDGLHFELEDHVLLVPEQRNEKPYIAIIKDIAQTHEGAVMVTGQWFYRPGEAEKKGGGYWQSRDSRELFYSFHIDEVPAESVMHQCVVHFIPENKQIPDRKEHPGFVVQRVYDTVQKRLYKLTDKDYEENKQHEIDLLVQKTLARLGDLPELESVSTIVDHEDQMKNKRLSRKRFMSRLDDSREDEGLSRSLSLKAKTPGSPTPIGSTDFIILSKFNMLTGETRRDKWLEKLLQSLQTICCPVVSKQRNKEEHGGSDVQSSVNNNKNSGSNHVKESPDRTYNDDVLFDWPDTAVSVVAALEKAANDIHSADFQKYNQKMRQLNFNLQSNAVLARRLLNKELEPAQILNMSPNELKEGLTAEEIASREPEDSVRMQMTDARCKRCLEKQVGLMDIIHTGRDDRYQLECVACGYKWYASRDNIASLTIEGPSTATTVGTTPLATAKFEDVSRILVSPRGSDKGANDVLKKTTEAHVPVLDKQRSFSKTHVEENPATSK